MSLQDKLAKAKQEAAELTKTPELTTENAQTVTEQREESQEHYDAIIDPPPQTGNTLLADATDGFDPSGSPLEVLVQEGILGNNGAQEVLGHKDKFNGLVERNPEEVKPYKPLKGDYKNLRLHRIVLSNGVVVTPNRAGYYTKDKSLPENLSKELAELLKYYEGKEIVEEVKESVK